MSKVLVLTSFGKDSVWDSGDPVIFEGLLNIVNSLRNSELLFHCDVVDDVDAVKWCDIVVQAGTPSWTKHSLRRYWWLAIEHRKPVYFLGIGLACHYDNHFWYGAEDFIALKDSGVLKLVVCRDRYAYYWLGSVLGVRKEMLHLLPCPAYFAFNPDPCVDKKSAVVSIPNPDETSRQNELTFFNWDYNIKCVIQGLEECGCRVSVVYQRSGKEHRAFVDRYCDYFGRKINTHESFVEFKEFMISHDVYIGYRNHGALPMAGAGKSALLLGTDYRQSLAECTPFLSHIDISYTEWTPSLIADWFGALNPSGVGQSNLNYRLATYERWQQAIEPYFGRKA